MSNTLPQVVCFGDSLFENAMQVDVGGFVHGLAEVYLNRADIRVRAFSGYNTSEIKPLCPSLVALKPRVVLLGFGNSDSALEGQIQHLSVDEFESNLEAMSVELAAHGAWLILITPVAPNETRIKSHSLNHTRSYALACRRIAERMRVEVVDLFHAMQLCEDWEKELLQRDGFSLSRKGNELLSRMVLQQLKQVLPLEDLPRLNPGSLSI